MGIPVVEGMLRDPTQLVKPLCIIANIVIQKRNLPRIVDD